MQSSRKAFVLRVWMEEPSGADGSAPVLRGSLQSVRSEEVAYFASYEQLIELLHQEVSAPNGDD